LGAAFGSSDAAGAKGRLKTAMLTAARTRNIVPLGRNPLARTSARTELAMLVETPMGVVAQWARRAGWRLHARRAMDARRTGKPSITVTRPRLQSYCRVSGPWAEDGVLEICRSLAAPLGGIRQWLSLKGGEGKGEQNNR
jgi:hypothetical protein